MAWKHMTPEQIEQYARTKPRPYDLTNAADLDRLFRETVGYARVALAYGTDAAGRRRAYEALRELHEKGWKFAPGDA